MYLGVRVHACVYLHAHVCMRVYVCALPEEAVHNRLQRTGAAIARLEAGEQVLRVSPTHVGIFLTLTVLTMAPYVLKKRRNNTPLIDLPDLKKMPS